MEKNLKRTPQSQDFGAPHVIGFQKPQGPWFLQNMFANASLRGWAMDVKGLTTAISEKLSEILIQSRVGTLIFHSQTHFMALIGLRSMQYLHVFLETQPQRADEGEKQCDLGLPNESPYGLPWLGPTICCLSQS